MNTMLKKLDRLAASSVIADVLALALDHRLFHHLQQPQTAAQLAAELNWHPEPTAPLLELLWSDGWLDREGERYVASQTAQALLCPQGERYLADAWRFRLRSLRASGQQLPTLVSQPLPGFSAQLAQDAAWAEAASTQIAQEQRALTAETACTIAATLPHFTRPATLLDMGGGPGLVSAALGQRYPQLHGVVQDLPLTAAVAQKNLTAAGLDGRFSARSELTEEERFDIIWCSSFLHFVADPLETLRQLRGRLRPGGVLIAAHAEIGSQPEQAREVLPFFLPLMLRGKHVFHHGEMTQLLERAGFSGIRCQEYPFPMAPLMVHVAFQDSAS
ncbi:class I SAM-dependent methyltransferase [Pseudomonas graminis]